MRCSLLAVKLSVYQLTQPPLLLPSSSFLILSSFLPPSTTTRLRRPLSRPNPRIQRGREGAAVLPSAPAQAVTTMMTMVMTMMTMMMAALMLTALRLILGAAMTQCLLVCR